MATPQLFSSPPVRRFSPPSGRALNRHEIRSFQDSTDSSSVIRNSRFLKVRQISVFANRSIGMKVGRAVFGDRRYLFSSSLLLSAHLGSHNVSSGPVFSSNSGGRHPQPGLFPLTGREEDKRQNPNVPCESLSPWQEEIKRVIHSKLLHQVHCHAGNARMIYENTQNHALVRENYQFENSKDPNEDREWLLPTTNSRLQGCDVISKKGEMPKSFNQQSCDCSVDKQEYPASHLMVSSENVGVRSSVPIHANHVNTGITNQYILTLELSSDDVGAKGFKSNGSVVQGIVTEIEKDDSKGVGAGIASGRESAITGSSVENNYVNNEPKTKLISLCDKVLIVNNIPTARRVVEKLTTKYKHLIHACDTEVSKIDVKEESPVNHGEVICFSIYSGSEADFDGKSYIWVDILDGGRELLNEFAPFFEDPSIKKVWHNYSFDSHVIENYGLKVAGFHADTMHLARLWDSSRRTEGGYSLEALSGDPKVMAKSSYSKKDDLLSGKMSMKSLFGRKKVKKDGSEGKLLYISPVEELQREEREVWIGYSVLDSKSTLELYESLKAKLECRARSLDGESKGTMFDFYEEYWRPFGELLVKMESEGMLVDRAYLAEIEKVATKEQQIAADKFRKWASTYCSDAKYMNVGSDTQLRQLFFGGMVNRKDPNEVLPETKNFKVPNVDIVIEEGKKSPSKYCSIELKKIGSRMETEMYTATGWPSVSVDALKALAGNVSSDMFEVQSKESIDQVGEIKCSSSYGTAFDAFGGNREGLEACCAIAALCEVCSIDSLISNFILPLQSDQISGKNGRIHCSLNINTETGRLSARRPNLQMLQVITR